MTKNFAFYIVILHFEILTLHYNHMFDKFTHKSQEAIINAQIIAQDHGQQQIEGLHILAALLSQNEGLVKPILERIGVNLKMTEKRIFETMERLPKTTIASNIGTVQGTAEAAMILERSKKEADKIGDEYISTEHRSEERRV